VKKRLQWIEFAILCNIKKIKGFMKKNQIKESNTLNILGRKYGYGHKYGLLSESQGRLSLGKRFCSRKILKFFKNYQLK